MNSDRFFTVDLPKEFIMNLSQDGRVVDIDGNVIAMSVNDYNKGKVVKDKR